MLWGMMQHPAQGMPGADPNMVYEPVERRVMSADIILVVTVLSDEYIRPRPTTPEGEHRLLTARIEHTIKGQLVDSDTSVTQAPEEGKQVRILRLRHSYSRLITYETGVKIWALQAGIRHFVIGREYFMLLDRRNHEFVCVYATESNYLLADQGGISKMIGSLEKMQTDRQRLEALLSATESLTPEEYDELRRLCIIHPVDYGEPTKNVEAWKEWWKEAGKAKFTLPPTWRETLEKLRQEVARQEPAAPAADPPPAPAPEKPPE
jgi:hypothetical protein